MSHSPPVLVGKQSGGRIVPVGTQVWSGAEGTVWVGVICAPGHAGEQVCVKAIDKPHPSLWDKLRILMEELKDFQSIATLQDIAFHETTGDNIAVVSRYCPGTNLRDIFETGKVDLTFAQRLRLARELCVTIRQFFLRHGTSFIVYNDLAPQNINVHADGLSLSLFDIDSAWAMNYRAIDGTVITHTGVKGTPGYRSPLQVRDPHAVPTRECMLWSLATLVYQLLTNTHPCALAVTAETQGLTEEDMVGEGFYPRFFGPTDDRPAPDCLFDIPAALLSLFHTAFLGPPKQRPSCDTWIAALDKLIEAEPVLAAGTPLRRRRRRNYVLAASLVFSLVAGRGYQLLPAGSERHEAVQNLQAPPPDLNPPPQPKPKPKPKPKSIITPALRGVVE